MRIEEDLKLDYSDVLFRPKRSTLSSRKDVEILLENDVNCFLIGETFLRAKNPGDKLRDLFPELN